MPKVHAGTPRGQSVTVTRDPEARLALAAERCRQAAEATDAQSRLNLLHEAVQLDPFEIDYRLALAGAKLDCGLLKDAVADYQAAGALWPDVPRVTLLRAQACLVGGQLKEAAELLSQFDGDEEAARLSRFLRVEIQLRQARSGQDWSNCLAQLQEMEVRPPETGLFCEKCLKLAVECGDRGLASRVVELAAEKIGPHHDRHPTFRLLADVASFDPDGCLQRAEFPMEAPAPAEGSPLRRERLRLEALLRAYRLVAAGRDRTPQDRAAALGRWQRLVRKEGHRWPELKDAYLQALGGWAASAYSSKQFALAGVLWSEAERVTGHNPAVCQNLALSYTRLGDERNAEWYWEQLARTWRLFSEMLPEAEGCTRLLIQKHQAFVEGAQKKLQNKQLDWRVRLDLGALFAREAVSCLALRQLMFKDPQFRCGVSPDDYKSAAERRQRVAAGCESLRCWLDLVAGWEGLGDHTALRHWRGERLESARAAAGGVSLPDRRFRAREKDAFKTHREQVVQQFVVLVLMAMGSVVEHADEMDDEARGQYEVMVRAALAFPLPLIRKGVADLVPNLEPDTDLLDVVRNYGLVPWFKPARRFLEAGNYAGAAAMLEKVQELAPGFRLGTFYLAQCRAGLEQFDEAYALATRALEGCDAGDELHEHLEKMVEHMDVARVRKALEKVEALLKAEQPAKAVAECRKALGAYPDHPYVLFVLAQACLADLDIGEARQSLVEAARRAKAGSDLEGAILKFQEQLEDIAPQAILSRAVPLMKDEKWDGAVKVLSKASELKKPSARVLFYTAVCHSRGGEVEKADAAARAALRECGPDEADLKKEIEEFLPQIPLARIAQELSAAQKAMNGKNWSGAMTHLQAAHRKVPDSPIVYYYKAICQLQMGRRDEARRSAEKGLEHAEGDQYKDVRSQLQEMVGNFRTSDNMNRVVTAMQGNRWGDALEILDGWFGAGLPPWLDWIEHMSPADVMKDYRSGMKGDSASVIAQAFFFRAVCKFRRRQESTYSFSTRDIENDAKVAIALGKDEAALMKQVLELLAATARMG